MTEETCPACGAGCVYGYDECFECAGPVEVVDESSDGAFYHMCRRHEKFYIGGKK